MTQSAPHDQQRALREELQALSDVVAPRELIDLLLERAFQNRATDVHLDPTREGLRVRLRVDGLLHDIVTLPNEMKSQVISRLKLMANMNITEHRLAQDGRISVTV
ncbi:MAG TPA: ATPase, T2SS/T4P/T4SS family, partial [Planctomycetaceae bacterium]|nr:ATPase, T2SS/T4P/T4SS family [Planctomycetaceae bacterium]